MRALRQWAASAAAIMVCICIAWPAQGAVGVQVAEPSAMDEAFYTALWELIQGRVQQAYEGLDRALDTQKPTENCYLYLRLYRTCFDLATKGLIPLDHSKEGKARIQALQPKDSPSAVDLVKIAVLLPVGQTPADVRPPLKTIVAHHADSPWAGWARWRLIEDRAVRIQEDVLKNGQPLGVLRLVQPLVACEIARSRPDAPPIMRKWKRFVLWGSLQGYGRYASEVAKTLRELHPADAPAAAAPTPTVPTWVLSEQRLLEWLQGLSGNPPEIVWNFFQDVRRSGVRLPDAIPADRDAFDRGATHRFR